MQVKCGDDGSSANNCTFTGGSWHAEFYKHTSAFFKPHEYIENVTLQGITFTNANEVNIVFNDPVLGNGLPSHLEIKDCVFKENELNQNIFIGVQDSSLVVEDSVFSDNLIQSRTEPQQFSSALIYGYLAPTVSIKNCKFLRNTLISAVFGEFLSVILVIKDHAESRNSTLSITDSCFDNNIGNTFSLVLTDDQNYHSQSNLQSNNDFEQETWCLGIGERMDINSQDHYTCYENFTTGVCPE